MGLMMARRNGLVECPHCHRMIEPEALGMTCEACGAEGCCECIETNEHGRDVCLDPFDSECPAAAMYAETLVAWKGGD
jgi:hypothetical protein